MRHRKFLAALGFAAIMTAAQAQVIQVDRNNRTIAVTATDHATATADIATVSIGFQLFAPDATTAYSQGSARSNAIVDALKKAGVPAKSIESRAQNLTRNQQYEPSETAADHAQKQFQLSQTWAVHTSAQEAAAVLHAAIEAGANDSGAIDWDVTDRNALQAQAAEKALVRARAIATQMASGLDAHLGPLIYASNQAPETAIHPMARPMMMKAVPQSAVAPLALAPQQVEESATVYAVFSIE